jgi:hypothetical protein
MKDLEVVAIQAGLREVVGGGFFGFDLHMIFVGSMGTAFDDLDLPASLTRVARCLGC